MERLEARRAAIEYRLEPCRTALNRVRNMGFGWSLNPYMGCEHRCSFCYVRSFEQRAQRPSDDRYGRSIRVKTNIATVLRQELGRKSWQLEMVAVGAATDPYQPAEGRFKLTRACLQVLAAFRNPTALITRGPMVVRDLDVLSELASRADLSISFSIPTLDPDVWRRTEPGTAPPRQRLRALETLVAAGIKAGVGMAPLLPGISDRPEQIEAVVKAARGAGATFLWGRMLYLSPGTREHFLAVLAKHWPDLMPRYQQLYDGRTYLARDAAAVPERLIGDLRRQHAIGDRRQVRLGPTLRPEPPRQLAMLL